MDRYVPEVITDLTNRLIAKDERIKELETDLALNFGMLQESRSQVKTLKAKAERLKTNHLDMHNYDVKVRQEAQLALEACADKNEALKVELKQARGFMEEKAEAERLIDKNHGQGIMLRQEVDALKLQVGSYEAALKDIDTDNLHTLDLNGNCVICFDDADNNECIARRVKNILAKSPSDWGRLVKAYERCVEALNYYNNKWIRKHRRDWAAVHVAEQALRHLEKAKHE